MNILICANPNPKPGDYTNLDWGRWLPTEWKYDYDISYCPGEVDIIISMSIATMSQAFDAKKIYPDAKLFVYNWDCYEWVKTSPRKNEANYERYGELVKSATEVWVPSNCTGRKVEEWWGVKNWKRIRSYCQYWDYDDVKDDGYILCALRKVPDRDWGVLEKACKELGLPLQMTHHGLPFEEYQRKVAHCSFIVSPLYEMSTGGMSLLEAYYLGKPCLLSDSPWHGGRDYLWPRAMSFNHNDIEDLKHALQYLWDYCLHHREELGASDAYRKEYIQDNFSQKRMINEMVERINATSTHSV